MVKLNKQINEIIQEETDKIDLMNKIEIFKKNGAEKQIINVLEKTENRRRWGDMMEEIAKRIFNFDERDNSEHDYKYNSIKIEQKASTPLLTDLKKGKMTYQYYDIRDTYDYDGLIFCNVDFTELKFYYISKRRLMELDLFKKMKRCRILNFNKVKDDVIELTPENIDKVITK